MLSPAKPRVGQIDLNLAAEGAFRADGEHVAEDEHADHEHGIDRRPAERRVTTSRSSTDPGQIKDRCDLANEMIVRNRLL